MSTMVTTQINIENCVHPRSTHRKVEFNAFMTDVMRIILYTNGTDDLV